MMCLARCVACISSMVTLPAQNSSVADETRAHAAVTLIALIPKSQQLSEPAGYPAYHPVPCSCLSARAEAHLDGRKGLRGLGRNEPVRRPPQLPGGVLQLLEVVKVAALQVFLWTVQHVSCT